MTSSTFDNLNLDKKNRVIQALLKEFSTYSLADAQVARIVTEAGIARGAFYKYFGTLQSAYDYLYQLAMHDIHTQLKAQSKYDAPTYFKQVEQFVNQSQKSEYSKFIKQHFTKNSSQVENPSFEQVEAMTNLDNNIWAASILSHEVIKQIMLYPDLKSKLLRQLLATLTSLEGK